MTTLFIATSLKNRLGNAEYSVGIDSLVSTALKCNLGSIYDDLSPVNKYELMKSVDTALKTLTNIHPKYKWVELMHFDVLHKYIYYEQLKRRLLNLIKARTHSLTKIVLSSSEDKVLLMVIKEICRELNLRMESKFDAIYPGKLLHIYRKKYDIPSKYEVDKYLNLVALISIFKKFKTNKIDVVYMDYPNLKGLPKDWSKFNFIYFRFINVVINKIKRKLNLFSDSAIIKGNSTDPSNKFNKFVKYKLLNVSNSSLVNILEHEYALFNNYYPNTHLDFLASHFSKYLLRLNPRSVVTYSSFSAAGLFVTKVARSLGLKVEYLPHGINNRYQIYFGSPDFRPDHILAWNSVAKNNYKKWGYQSVVFGHPSLQSEKKRLGAFDYKKSRRLENILVVLNPGSPDYPDQCFRDVITLGKFFYSNYQIMPEFKSKRIYFESTREVNFKDYYDSFRSILGFEPKFLDCDLNLASISNNYDLVIVCMYSTGLLYCLLSGSPVVILAREKMELDLVDTNKIRIAYSLFELKKIIEKSKYNMSNRLNY